MGSVWILAGSYTEVERPYILAGSAFAIRETTIRKFFQGLYDTRDSPVPAQHVAV